MGHAGKPEEITTIANTFISFEELLAITESSNGVFKAILQYVLSGMPNDLVPSPENRVLSSLTPYYADENNVQRKIEIHHIVPRNWIAKNIDSESNKIYRDSSLNQTYITRQANAGYERSIGDQSPSQYLNKCANETLAGHFIPAKWHNEQITTGNFRDALEARFDLIRKAIIQRISTRS